MCRSKLTPGLAWVIGAMMSASTMASPIVGTGLPSSNAALAGGSVIDFDSDAAGTSAVTLNYPGVSMTGDGTLRISDAFNGSFNVTGNALALTTNDSVKEVIFSFTGLVDAFGFNIGGTDSADTWNIVAYAATGTVLGSQQISALGSSNAGEFFGLAMPGIASAKLSNTGDADYVVLDNFTYLSSVPEPVSIALVCIGLVGMGYRRRKQVP